MDLSVFDLYTGECEFIKAGASATFIKRKDKSRTFKFHKSSDRSGTQAGTRFRQTDVKRRRFCDHGDGRGDGCAANRRTGCAAGNDHSGNVDDQPERVCKSHFTTGTELE